MPQLLASREFFIPDTTYFSEHGEWPAAAICVKYVSLFTYAGVTGGDVWVQIRDRALSNYDGVLFLERIDYLRERIPEGERWEYDQWARLTFRPPDVDGEAQERQIVEIDLPYDEHFRGVCGFHELRDYGPLPILRSEITTSWTLDMDSLPAFTVFPDVPARGGSGAPMGFGSRIGGRTLLRRGGSSVLPVTTQITSGPGYRVASTGGKQTITADGGGSPRPAVQFQVMIAMYWQVTRNWFDIFDEDDDLIRPAGSDEDEGWNISWSDPGRPYHTVATLTKVALVVLQTVNGVTSIVPKGVVCVSMANIRNDHVTADSATWVRSIYDEKHWDGLETYARHPETDVPVEVGGVAIPGEFDVDGNPVIASVDDYDTWPCVSGSWVLDTDLDASDVGHVDGWDMRRVER